MISASSYTVELKLMPALSRSHLLPALAFAAALGLAGCGGSSEPPAKAKPANSVSPEVEAALKKMQSEAAAKPIPKAEDVEAEKAKTKKGVRGGVQKRGGVTKKK